MNYKISIIGAKDTTITMAEYFLNNICKPDCIITIDENYVNAKDISGFSNIELFAEENKIEIFKVKNYSMKDKETNDFFNNNSFEIAICMGWQRLIPLNILNKFKFGVFGFHGSCAYLPYGRGRSPLNWSIIKGDERFILNLFKYDEQADSPNVFTNRTFQINKYDTIRTLQYKYLLCSYEMITELIKAYNNNKIEINYSSKDYNHFYEKRTPQDGKIDFTSRTMEIYNLIRAVTKPFPGAFAYIKNYTDSRITIWDAVPFDSFINFSKYEPGEIIDIFDNMPVIRTLDGSLLIKNYETTHKINPGNILI